MSTSRSTRQQPRRARPQVTRSRQPRRCKREHFILIFRLLVRSGLQLHGVVGANAPKRMSVADKPEGFASWNRFRSSDGHRFSHMKRRPWSGPAHYPPLASWRQSWCLPPIARGVWQLPAGENRRSLLRRHKCRAAVSVPMLLFSTLALVLTPPFMRRQSR